ncbi:MAG: NADH-quinone oxidoreductase subunit K [Candidatus Thiodiazotropha endolucinida]
MGWLVKKNVLRYLLTLETIALALYVGAVIGFRDGCNGEIALFVMGISACEAAVGLGMLISLARVKGRDFTDVTLRIKV